MEALSKLPKKPIIPEPKVPLSQLCNVCHEVLKIRWYRCLRCYNFRLCVPCYDKKRSWTGHFFHHPIQCVLTKQAQELFYQGESSHTGPFVKSYTCPYCAKMGLSAFKLQEHIAGTHFESSAYVNCPMCFSIPNTPDKVMQNLLDHLSTYHYPGNVEISDASDVSSSP